MIVDGIVLTYEELWSRALEAASAIQEVTEVGSRVALLADNGVAYVTAYWGTLLAACTTVEISPSLGDGELGSQIESSDAALVLASEDHLARLEALGIDATPGESLSGSRSANEALPPISDEDLASIVHTSGTTGEVKGVCLSHHNLSAATDAIVQSFESASLGPGERFSGFLPLYYTYGKSILHVATALGAPIVFTNRIPTPAALFSLLAEQSITHLSLVPFLANQLLQLPEFVSTGLPHLRRITIAGGALHPEKLEDLVQRFPNAVMPMYGLTEASTRVTAMPPSELAKRPESCGRPIAGVELRIIDDEIHVRGPNVCQGYFRDPALTAETVKDGWLRTGDLGRIDDEGYLTIVGRLKEMIKVLGESVSAASVEAAIAELPSVAEVAVTAMPDERSGEAIRAFVVPRSGEEVLKPEIRRHCATRLGKSRVPTEIHLVAALPKSGSGKVRKHLLEPPTE